MFSLCYCSQYHWHTTLWTQALSNGTAVINAGSDALAVATGSFKNGAICAATSLVLYARWTGKYNKGNVAT